MQWCKQFVSTHPESKHCDDAKKIIDEIGKFTPPVPPIPAVVPPTDLETRINLRKTTLSVASGVSAAIGNKEISIIDVADTCTADQFDAKNTKLLQDWVAAGHVLWVNSNVLSLFEIGRTPTRGLYWGVECLPADGSNAILKGVKRVKLKVGIRESESCNLDYPGVIPLLQLEQGHGLEAEAGTVVWSIVPYGNGWISNPKPLDMREWGQRVFWGKFCQFSLHEIPWPPPPPPTPPGQPRQVTLTGNWQASTGAQFRIVDDGKTLTVDLAYRNNELQALSGKLARGQLNATAIKGTFYVTSVHAPKQYTIRVSATIADDSHLHVTCENWPQFDRRSGKYTGRAVLNELWTRSNRAPMRSRRQ